MEHICLLDKRPYAFALTSGAIVRLVPGANAVQGLLKDNYEELIKDGYFVKYQNAGLIVIAKSEKEIPWDRMPHEVKMEHNSEEQARLEAKQEEKAQAQAQREFKRDLQKLNRG